MRPAGEFLRTGLRFIPLLLAVTAGGVAPQASNVAAAEAAAVIEMTNQLTYTPRKVTVNVGDTVEWKNSSLLVHTVTADPEVATKQESVALPPGGEPFDSGNIDPEGTFRQTFKVPGTYRYFCIPHEGAAMVGEVVVKPLPDPRHALSVFGGAPPSFRGRSTPGVIYAALSARLLPGPGWARGTAFSLLPWIVGILDSPWRRPWPSSNR